MSGAITVVVLAAGKGTRMNSERPKVLHDLCGRPMVGWCLDAALGVDPARVVAVVGHGGEAVETALRSDLHGRELDVRTVLQEPQLGTGHALQVAAPEIGACERVVVTYGDMPLLRPESLRALVAAQEAAGPDAVSLLTARVPHPFGYGRVVRDADGAFVRIVEEKDATDAERRIDEINLGVYCFARAHLDADLARLANDNAQGEYYVTDLAGFARDDGRPVVAVELEDAGEGAGVNDLAQLAAVRTAVRYRILARHMAAGVRIEDPATTFIDHDVEIGSGTEVLPCTVIRGGVRIGAGCEVGPFTHLRVGTVLEDRAEVGNFTECKKSTVGAGSKAKHLSYLGDVTIGARANIGAGTIFANYDGRAKHPTVVGDGAFVGSGTIVVAPNTVPDGATTGAGAVVTRSARMRPGEVWVGTPARRLAPRDDD